MQDAIRRDAAAKVQAAQRRRAKSQRRRASLSQAEASRVAALEAAAGLIQAAQRGHTVRTHFAPPEKHRSLKSLVSASNQLARVVRSALLRVGESDVEKQTDTIVVSLAGLYIRTPDHLRQGLSTPEVHEQIVKVLRGMLLSAVKEELKRNEHGTTWKMAIKSTIATVRSPQSNARVKMNAPLLRRLEIARVDVTQLSQIDQISQTFRARLFLILRICGGALDDHLLSEFEGFPTDEFGRPTFRPSAKWYLSQVDFPNGRDIQVRDSRGGRACTCPRACTPRPGPCTGARRARASLSRARGPRVRAHQVLESKVTTAGNDLQLIKRIDGEFFERFELQSFPFDAQDLTITVSVNCANEGPVPVEFGAGGPSDSLGVDTVNFAFADVWDLSPEITTEITTVGANAKRRFPAVLLRACVSRKPAFVVMNVMVRRTRCSRRSRRGRACTPVHARGRACARAHARARVRVLRRCRRCSSRCSPSRPSSSTSRLAPSSTSR